MSGRSQSKCETVASKTQEVEKNENSQKNCKHFWSFYEDFKDDEVEIKEEQYSFSIEDLVVEEVTKYRERNTGYIEVNYLDSFHNKNTSVSCYLYLTLLVLYKFQIRCF